MLIKNVNKSRIGDKVFKVSYVIKYKVDKFHAMIRVWLSNIKMKKIWDFFALSFCETVDLKD